MSSTVYSDAALRLMQQALEDARSLPDVTYPVVPGTRINALDSYTPTEHLLAVRAWCGLQAVLTLHRIAPQAIGFRSDIYNLCLLLERRYRLGAMR